MPFGNGKNDYPGTAEKGFGSEKTAEESPFSTLCPECRKYSVKEASSENEFNEYFSETLVCTNCGWRSGAKLI